MAEAMFRSQSLHLEVADFLSQLRVGVGGLSTPPDNGQESKCDNLKKISKKMRRPFNNNRTSVSD
jgi:hypothetical protein